MYNESRVPWCKFVDVSARARMLFLHTVALTQKPYISILANAIYKYSLG